MLVIHAQGQTCWSCVATQQDSRDFKDLTHTTVQHSSNLLLMLLAARLWTLRV